MLEDGGELCWFLGGNYFDSLVDDLMLGNFLLTKLMQVNNMVDCGCFRILVNCSLIPRGKLAILFLDQLDKCALTHSRELIGLGLYGFAASCFLLFTCAVHHFDI